MDEVLLVGAASRVIEIAEGTPMAGYAARLEGSLGTGDPPLHATAVAIDDEVLVTLDVIGVDPPLVDAIRARAPQISITVTATHTHAGPAVWQGGVGEYSAQAAEAVVTAAAEAVQAAVEAREPCTVEWLEPSVPGVSVNRRSMEVSAAAIHGLRWLRDGQVRGCLVSYPCHPTVLGPLNRATSPDYPGFLRAEIERRWGGVCVFATGCAGDQSTGESPDASYATGAGDQGRTQADAERIGRDLATAVTSGRWRGVELSRAVQLSRAVVCLDQAPLDEQSPLALADRWRQEKFGADPGVRALLDCWIGWAQRPDAGLSTRWNGEVSLITLGEAQLVLLPGEPFLAAAEQIISQSSGPTMVLGYASDVCGYFPSRDQYPLGGYEVIDAHRYYGQPAPFVPGAMETLVETAVGLLRRAGGASRGSQRPDRTECRPEHS